MGTERFCFNEAGADCPGMHFVKAIAKSVIILASMRPGQTAPECNHTSKQKRIQQCCFNEAGADCPGMRATALAAKPTTESLQ